MSVDSELKDAMHQIALAKINESLGGDVLSKIIQDIMQYKRESYNYKEKPKTYLEELVDEIVKNDIRLAVREYMNENSQQIKDAVKLALESKAEVFASSIVDAFDSGDWKASLNVTVKRKDEDDD